MGLEELEKRLDENTQKIMLNLEKIEHNSNKIGINEQNIHKNSLALDILKDYKKQNKRLVIIWLITFIAFICLLVYTIWLLNDIGTYDEIRSQEITDIESIEYSDIINGDYNGND